MKKLTLRDSLKVNLTLKFVNMLMLLCFTLIATPTFSTLINSANAGEFLRMKAETIKTENLLEQLNFSFFRQDFTGPSEHPKNFDYNNAHYFVIQFKDRISETDKATLTKQGLEAKSYLPDDALVIRGDMESAQIASLAANVKAVVPYQPHWKINPQFFAANAPKNGFIHISLIDESERKAVVQKLNILGGLRIQFVGRQEIIVEGSSLLVNEISQIDGIGWIEPLSIFVPLYFAVDRKAQPAKPAHLYNPDLKIQVREENTSDGNSPLAIETLTGYESGTKVMNFEAAWNRGFHGEGQVVGMADTGVNTGDIATLPRDLSGLIKGIPFGFGSGSWEDPEGHGTHVAGSVVGNGAASQGVIRGGAYQAHLVVESLWSPVAQNISFETEIDSIMQSAYDNGARIHSDSWGDKRTPGEYGAFCEQVDAYLWNHPDMLILFAAGNEGADLNQDGIIDEGSIAVPATAKNVLTVGASKNYVLKGGLQLTLGETREASTKFNVEPIKSSQLSDNPNGLVAFSSRGPTTDGRIKPEIVAPGSNIVSTRSHHPDAGVLWGEFNSDYVYSGGTSMAAPLTAGAAAVVRQYLVQTRGIANPSGALVKATLMHTARDLYPGQFGFGPKQEIPKKRPNNHEGYGLVDMDAATKLNQETQIIDDNEGVGLSEEKSTVVVVSGNGALRATLNYTDAPGTSSAAKALVNDIDLQVISPSGQVFELADRTNNSEMLDLQGLAPGNYKVVIKGINVPQGKNGKQPYALLISTN